MDADLSIAAIAALIGKRARARMLTSQMDGRAHAAKELAGPWSDRAAITTSVSPSAPTVRSTAPQVRL